MYKITVEIEGVALPQHIVDNIVITFPFGGYAQASFTIPGDVFSPGVFKDSRLYERITSLLLHGYPNVKIKVNDHILFEGLVTSISFSRSYGSSDISFECHSQFALTRLFNVFVHNISYINDTSTLYYNGFAFPEVAQLGGQDAIFRELLAQLRHEFEGGKIPDGDPIRRFAELIFRLYDRIDDEFAIKDWARHYLDRVPLYEYVTSFPPNSRHLVRFFLESLENTDLFFAILTQELIKEGSSMTNLWDLFLKFLSLFQLQVVEVPTINGTEIIVKPIMMFHKPPLSNLIPSHMLIGFSVTEETGIEKPTRTYVRPSTTEVILAQNADRLVGAIAMISNMAAAPSELEEWTIRDVARQLGLSVDDNADILEVARLVYDNINATGRSVRKRYHAYLTEEERFRGIIPNFVDLPPGISDAIKSYGPYGWLLLKELALNAHYATRARYSTVSITSVFNPHFVPGHTFMFSDGFHKYFAFATNVVHSISTSGATTTVSGINFTRLTNEDSDKFVEFVSVFEMVENGDEFQTWTDDFLRDYYNLLFDTEIGDLEDMDRLEDYKFSPEQLDREISVYEEWRRELGTEGKPIVEDEEIKTAVEEFVKSITRHT